MHRIALDWGSSNLRAYAVNANGEITHTQQANTGVFSVANHAFEHALRALIGDWLVANPTVEICAAGMIGSANGWREAPYVATPASMQALRANVMHIPFELSQHVLKIVPGVRHGAGGEVDVMRGEETQIFGVLQDESSEEMFCLPGTHCKWVLVRGGAIVDFRTHFTGELYQWLITQSSISKVLERDAPFDERAFDEAAARAVENPSDLLQQLFSLRAGVVAREKSAGWSASAAQGILIGSDVANALQYLRRKNGSFSQISIVGSGALNGLYARVLRSQGLAARAYEADASVRGLHRIFSDS